MIVHFKTQFLLKWPNNDNANAMESIIEPKVSQEIYN